MNKKHHSVILFVIICISGYGFLLPGIVFSSDSQKVAIVVSKKIRPYMMVVNGMTKVLAEKEVSFQFFFLSVSETQDSIVQKLENSAFDLVTAVGPEAAKVVWRLKQDQFRLFTAVLDPGSVFETQEISCGISLRIPVEQQVRELSNVFLNISRIGLLFDPAHNSLFYQNVSRVSEKYGIVIVPLKVDSKKQIPISLSENWQQIDALWLIPDRTVISEKIIQYIIKKGIYHKKGVIGYNSFFIRSGAVFSFDFDYTLLGIQTAEKMIRTLETGECFSEAPRFKTIMNHKVVTKVDLQVRGGADGF